MHQLLKYRQKFHFSHCTYFVINSRSLETRVKETGKVHTGFLCGYLRERHNLDDLGVDARIILRQIYKKWDGGRGLD
jgi:hypothetical protein